MRLNFLRSLAGGLAAFSIALAGCGGGGGGSSSPNPIPTVIVTATPTPVATSSTSSNSATAFTCPSSDGASSVAVGSGRSSSETVRRMASHHTAQAAATSGLIAVTYDRSAASRMASSIAAREASTGARPVASYDFPYIGTTMHVLSVPTSQIASVESLLRAQTGVLGVGLTGERRFAAKVTTPYFPNDPYFDGFKTTGATAPPATYEVGPYEETNNVPGQWDMHAIGLEYAFGYSQGGNGSGIVNANALGSSSIKIAMIDTGEDVLHPELASKVVYQKCYITNEAGTAQSISNFAPDPFGHGTDTAGIAAAATNNNIGFAGAGGNVVLYDYRVFPTPDDNCGNDNNSDAQCSSDTADIYSAITDAVNRGVNVISISLGGGDCTTGGVDSDPVEGSAIANAIAKNIIVVAAAGNSGPPLNAPACDSGVIAAGATSLDDGSPNGTGHTGGTASKPVEYVASYSAYGSPAASAKSASAWGIVAPGGDPGSDIDADDLHWIENIWTSTPYQSSSSDTTFEGECTNDYPNGTLTTNPDCRTLIAGTSMSTPHVAGAAALILSVNASYQSPTAMKTLLCTTADDIGDPHEGCGRVNVYRAMATALSDPNLP